MRRLKSFLRNLPVAGDVLVRIYRALPFASGRPQGPAAATLKRIQRQLEREADAQVVGPWSNGLEGELLYWIPLLRLLVKRGSLDPERALSIADPWKTPLYAGVARECRLDSDSVAQLSGPEVESIVRPFREGHAGVSVPMRNAAYQPYEEGRAPGDEEFDFVLAFDGGSTADLADLLFRLKGVASVAVTGSPDLALDDGVAQLDGQEAVLARGRTVVGAWCEATAVSLFAGTRTVVLEPDDPARKRDVALAERVAQQIGTPFAVVQPQALASLAAMLELL